jgi:hypothetical protein
VKPVWESDLVIGSGLWASESNNDAFGVGIVEKIDRDSGVTACFYDTRDARSTSGVFEILHFLHEGQDIWVPFNVNAVPNIGFIYIPLGLTQCISRCASWQKRKKMQSPIRTDRRGGANDCPFP